MAILLREKRGAEFARQIEERGPVLISAGNAIELATVSSRHAGLFDAAMVFLKQVFVRVEPVDAHQVALAAEAYRRFGKGHHSAKLNFGDVFAYALAQSRGLPLLFQGNDFAKTDVTPAAISADRHSTQRLGDEPLIVHQRRMS